jgi:hypothetical protein
MNQSNNQSKKDLNRLCCVCDKPLYGRSDKVFCDVKCKNIYHAEIRNYLKKSATFKPINSTGFFIENIRNFS